MELSLKSIGKCRNGLFSILELTVRTYNGTTLTEDVSNLDGSVDKELIHSLREIADELEAQNNLLNT